MSQRNRYEKVPIFMTGFVVFIMGAAFFAMVWMSQGNKDRAYGTVTDVEDRSWTDTTGVVHPVYHTHVKYKTETSDTLTGWIYSDHRFKFKAGQSVYITYEAGFEQLYTAKSYWHFVWTGGIMLAGIGIIVISFRTKVDNWDKV